jgi:hypothetical protein
MVGKIVPYIVIGYVQMTLVLTVGALVFRVPIVGSLGLLYALAALFIAANLALGLFFSSVAQTQQQAMQMSFFFMLPNILLSGFMFPWEAMPRPPSGSRRRCPSRTFLRDHPRHRAARRGVARRSAARCRPWRSSSPCFTR